MVECDDIDKKKNKKCESPAKWLVKTNGEEDYIHPRCGRHSRNKDKILIENKYETVEENKKRGRNSKTLKIDENNEIKIIKEEYKEKEDIQKLPHQNNNNDKKMEILFTKIDELCNLLNEKI